MPVELQQWPAGEGTHAGHGVQQAFPGRRLRCRGGFRQSRCLGRETWRPRGWFAAAAFIDIASYLVAAAIITGVAIRSTDRPGLVAPRIAGLLRQGLRHIAGTSLLRGLLATSWVYWTANAALTVLLIPFAATRLHSSGQAVGHLIAGLGVGYLCGSAISKTLITRFATRTVLTVAYASVGLCFLVAFTATALPVALVAVTASGVPGAVAQVVTGHRLQTSTPDAVLGRVAAAFHTSDAVAAVVGALIAPAVVALTDLGVALAILMPRYRSLPPWP